MEYLIIGIVGTILLFMIVVGFVLGISVKLLNDEQGKFEIATKARAKLSDEEADALGL